MSFSSLKPSCVDTHPCKACGVLMDVRVAIDVYGHDALDGGSAHGKREIIIDQHGVQRW